MKRLKEALKVINKIPNINGGGCLIAAYAVYLYLRKYNELSDFSLICYNDLLNEDTNEHLLFEKYIKYKGKPYIADHYAIYYEDNEYLLDGNQYKNVIILPNYYNFNKLYKESMLVDDWCETFDRKYIRVIERKLGINLDF